MDPELSERIVARRLRAQRLTGAPCATPEEAVGRLLGVQAQDYGPATWSVGGRATGATEASVEEAFNAGRILRTHVLRPTWHFVLPADLRWLLTATASRIRARDARRYAELGLEETTLRRAHEVVTTVLRGGHALTRGELAAELADSGISPEGQRLPYLLMSAELNALVCSGPRRDKQQTYMLLGDRAPEAECLSRDQALAELAARFFVGHGPATVKDLAWWASLTQAEARAAIERAGSRLRHEETGGLELWSADDPDEGAQVVRAPAAPAVRLIQGYDEIVMGHSETRWLLASPGSSWVAATPPVGRLVILLDGRVGGFWRRTIKKDALIVEAALLEPFDDTQTRALEDEAARYGEFLGLAASLVLAPGGGAGATRRHGGRAG